MPAFPEIVERAAQVRPAEIGAEIETQYFGRTDGYLRVCRKIYIQLEREKYQPQYGRKTRNLRRAAFRRVLEDRIDIDSQPVRYYHFLEKPDEHFRYTFPCFFIVELLNVVELRQQMRSPLDRPGHQLRKETDECQKRHDVLCRLDLLFINVYDIAERLECIETDTYRQDNVHGRH